MAFCANCDATDLGIDGKGNMLMNGSMLLGNPPLSAAEVPSLAMFQKARPSLAGAPHSARMREAPFNMFNLQLEPLQQPLSARDVNTLRAANRGAMPGAPTVEVIQLE